MRLSYACGHELFVHGLDEDGAATAVQTGAICDFHLLHLAMRSCRQQQEHLLIVAERARRRQQGAPPLVRRAPVTARRRPRRYCNVCDVREDYELVVRGVPPALGAAARAVSAGSRWRTASRPQPRWPASSS